jgi:hypothetical protein
MSHSFLKESKLYIEYGTKRYRIYTSSAISFSQTFAEDSYPVKTLHDQSKMFQGSTITKANPASFSFTVPLTAERDESVVMDLITGESTNDIVPSFTLWVQTGSSTFKMENCVISSAAIAFNPKKQFAAEVEGQGTKLIRVGNESYAIPGTHPDSSTQSEWDDEGSSQLPSSTRTPLLVYPHVTLDSLSMSSILGATILIQNNISWLGYETLQQSLAGNMMFPSAYTVTSRVVSGAITQYQTDNNNEQFETFSTNSAITITGKKASDNTDFWKLILNPVMYTARMEPNNIYTQSYDYRSLDNGEELNAQISIYN